MAMQNEEMVLTDVQHREYSEMLANELIVYRNIFSILEQWYQEIGEHFETYCRTNYRDAWLHYKKMYEKRNYVSVMQECHAAEEHLIRAYKDAVFSYFLHYITSLESIYKQIKDGVGLDEQKKSQIEGLFFFDEFPSITDADWSLELYELLEKHDCRSMYTDVLWYLFLKDLDVEQTLILLQNCIHKIKNYRTRLRLKGADIYRPSDHNEYANELIFVYNEMIDVLTKLHLKTAMWYMDGTVASQRSESCSEAKC